MLRLTVAPRFEELQVPPREFIAFLKTAFAMKRKTLVNNLKGDHPQQEIKAALASAELRADVRAEAVGLEKMAQVFKLLQ